MLKSWSKILVMAERGSLIVFEGGDRSGKSTQSQMLVDYLNKNGRKAKLMKFPERTGVIGSAIDSYLKQTSDELNDQAAHLLFSADRWKAVDLYKETFRPSILKDLSNGVSLIVDRYAYSGVAFSAAKGLDFDWCKNQDVGLPKPDAVIFLDLSAAKASKRGGFGEERYEKLAFQETVMAMYQKLRDPSWLIIDADIDASQLQINLQKEVVKIIDRSKLQSIGELWKCGNDESHSNGCV